MKASPSMKRITLGITLIILCLLAFLQVYEVLNNYGIVWGKRAWRSRQLSGIDRSALFLFDDRGAAYLDFLTANTPENGSVIVPPRALHFSQQNILQFFFMPKGVPNCLCSQSPADYSPYCLACLREPNHTIPALGDFPGAAAMEGYKQFVPFPIESGFYKGVYISLTADPFTELVEVETVPLLGALLTDMAILLSILMSGAMLVHTLHPTLAKIDTWIVALPVGAGMLTWIVFLLGWAGMRIELYTFLLAWLLITLPALYINTHRKTLPFPGQADLRSIPHQFTSLLKNPLFLILVLTSAFLMALALIISIGRGYSLFDGIANWGLKGYAIAQEHSIYAGTNWGGHGLSYPQNIHLQIALFKLADNDLLPGSKLLYPLYAIILCLACYRFWIRSHTPRLIAAASALLLLSVPELFRFATYGWGNMIFSSYLVIGVLFFVEGLDSDSSRNLLLGSVLLGLTAWTRPEGIGFSVAITSTTILVSLLIKTEKKVKLVNTIPLLLIPGIWLLFSYQFMHGDEIGDVIGGMTAAIANGSFNLDAFKTMLPFAWEHLTDTAIWGWLYPLLVLVAPFLVLITHKQNHKRTLLAFIAAGCAFLIPHFMFFAAWFTKVPGYEIFLEVSYDRALFPGSILLLCALISLIRKAPQTEVDISDLPVVSRN